MFSVFGNNFLLLFQTHVTILILTVISLLGTRYISSNVMNCYSSYTRILATFYGIFEHTFFLFFFFNVCRFPMDPNVFCLN